MELNSGCIFGARSRRRNIPESCVNFGFCGLAGSRRFQKPGIATTINAPAVMAGPSGAWQNGPDMC
jgi:hypothetical protein